MSIARQLEQSVMKLRVLIQRDNGDILHAAPAILDDIVKDADRVRALEEAACINTDVLKEFRQDFEATGGKHGEKHAH